MATRGPLAALVGCALAAGLVTAAPAPAAPPAPAPPAAPVPTAACRAPADKLVDRQATIAVAAARRKLAALPATPAAGYPAFAERGATSWVLRNVTSWTSGFTAGAMWKVAGMTRDGAMRAKARRWTAPLAVNTRSTSHDIGFILQNSFGEGVRLTGNRSYQRVLDEGAKRLAEHYSPIVGANWSWSEDPFTVIIDSGMNLELMFASGDPALHDLAHEHALTLVRSHQRVDGSTYHVVDFDPATGEIAAQRTVQGYRNWSTWARGQAWAVYAFTTAYRYTGDARLKVAADRAANWWIAHLPADCVPYVDFAAPRGPGRIRDSSAAAVASAALFDLSTLGGRSSTLYRTVATAMLSAVTRPPYLSTDLRLPSILLRSSPQWTPWGVDRSVAWGDYYVLEAIERFRGPVPPPAWLTGSLSCIHHAAQPGIDVGHEVATSPDGSCASRTKRSRGTI